MSKVKVDPVTVMSLWRRLVATTEEIGVSIRKSCRSEIIRETGDFSVGLFDLKGQIVAQGNFAAGQLGSMPFLMKSILEEFPLDSWHPGDSVICNTPWLGAGHLPDIYLTEPIFYEGRLVGFGSAIIHHVDIGGLRPGSVVVQGVSETIQEGLHIPILKWVKEGKVNDEVTKIILANVRLPEKTMGDLLATKGAVEGIGFTAMSEIIERYGVDTLLNCYEEIISRTEKTCREAIAALPAGKYSGESYLDDYGPGTEPVKVHVTIEATRDGTLYADFTGTDPQVNAGINCYMNYTKSYVTLSLKAMVYPAMIPHNEGGIKPIVVTAPEGCICNPKPGSASGARHIMSQPVTEAMMQALGQLLPERAVGFYGGLNLSATGGIDSRTGKKIVLVEFHFGSSGARATKDGLDFQCGPFNVRNVPIEVEESIFPVLIERLEPIPDTGGPGKYRGGVGFRKDVRYRMMDDISWSGRGFKEKVAATGVFGGKSGKPGTTVLYTDGEERFLEAKGTYQLKQGDCVSYRLAGAGGYGDPLERNEEAVLTDVIERLATIEGASSDYGVVIDKETLTVDYEQTKRLRASLKAR